MTEKKILEDVDGDDLRWAASALANAVDEFVNVDDDGRSQCLLCGRWAEYGASIEHDPGCISLRHRQYEQNLLAAIEILDPEE